MAYNVPRTTVVRGTVRGRNGSTFATVSGTSTTTETRYLSGTQRRVTVVASLVPVEWRDFQPSLGIPLIWSEDTGQWLWSKPDKDVLIDALGYLTRRFDETQWPPSFGEAVAADAVPLPTFATEAVEERSDAARVSTAAPTRSSPPLTNDDVGRMVGAGIGADVVLQKIRTSQTDFRLDVDDLIQLRESGVPDAILSAMLDYPVAQQQPDADGLRAALRPGPPLLTVGSLDGPGPAKTDAAVEPGTQTLYQAIRNGWVTTTFVATGGSSGDVVKVRVAKTQLAPPGPLALTVSPGTMLVSLRPDGQNMIVSGLRGRDVGDGSYVSETQVVVPSAGEVTYVLSVFCAEFGQDNPSSGDRFLLVQAYDPVATCIADQLDALSVATAQAAVWMHTDQMTFGVMRERFEITEVEWDNAESAYRSCT